MLESNSKKMIECSVVIKKVSPLLGKSRKMVKHHVTQKQFSNAQKLICIPLMQGIIALC